MGKFKKYEIGIGQGMTIDLGQLLPKDHLAFFAEEQVSKLDLSLIHISEPTRPY